MKRAEKVKKKEVIVNEGEKKNRRLNFDALFQLKKKKCALE